MLQTNYDLSVLNFILALKSLDFDVEYIRDADGIITGATNQGIITYGYGADYESAHKDLVSAIRTWSEIYFERFEFFYKHNPAEYPYALKVMLSSEEELSRCLNGKITEDI